MLKKGIDMYRNDKVNVPILGLVENMAYFTPAELPDNKYYIFGKEGAKQLAKEMGCPTSWRRSPLVQSICENGDKGEPSAVNVDSVTGQAFLNLAQAVVTVVNRRNKEQAPTKESRCKKHIRNIITGVQFGKKQIVPLLPFKVIQYPIAET